MPGYDMDLDMKVKAVGNDLFGRLRALSGLEPVESHRFAVVTCQDALGALPIGDGLDRLSDAQVQALLPKVEAARVVVAVLAAVLEQRGRNSRRPAWPWGSWLPCLNNAAERRGGPRGAGGPGRRA